MSTDTLTRTPYPNARSTDIEFGALIDATDEARRLGFLHPVAITRAAWEDSVRWDEEFEARKSGYSAQEQVGRLRDVLWMALVAAKRSQASRTYFTLDRVSPEGAVARTSPVTLAMTIGPGDQGEPVITIGMP